MAECVAAVIPVINEAGAIGPTIRALPHAIIANVIVVDGGSRDATVEEARAAGAEVLVEARRGYGRACMTGALHAQALGAGIVLFLDGDGADPAEEARQLIDPILSGAADFVLASRTRGRREPGSMGVHQVIAGRLVGAAVGLVGGMPFTDMSAFRAIRMDCLVKLGMREMTYGWNLEMQLRAAAAGLRVQEVALPYRRRIAGRSKVAGTFRGTFLATGRIVATLIRVALEVRNERKSVQALCGRTRLLLASWSDLFRRSTSSEATEKSWMPGRGPGMTVNTTGPATERREAGVAGRETEPHANESISR